MLLCEITFTSREGAPQVPVNLLSATHYFSRFRSAVERLPIQLRPLVLLAVFMRKYSMPATVPTIEDFFSLEVQSHSSPLKPRATSCISGRALTANPKPVGDGFTPSELSTALTLSQGHWQPQQPYDDASIGQLSPGSRRISFTARVVNLYDRIVQSKVPKAAKGCLKVLLRDDEAALLVRTSCEECFKTTHSKPFWSIGQSLVCTICLRSATWVVGHHLDDTHLSYLCDVRYRDATTSIASHQHLP